MKLWSYVRTTAGICWETLVAATLSLVGVSIEFPGLNEFLEVAKTKMMRRGL